MRKERDLKVNFRLSGNGCGKVCHLSKANAKKMARKHKSEMGVYFCGVCNYWHLTTKHKGYSRRVKFYREIKGE